jgi:hypothetical protein
MFIYTFDLFVTGDERNQVCLKLPIFATTPIHFHNARLSPLVLGVRSVTRSWASIKCFLLATRGRAASHVGIIAHIRRLLALLEYLRAQHLALISNFSPKVSKSGLTYSLSSGFSKTSLPPSPKLYTFHPSYKYFASSTSLPKHHSRFLFQNPYPLPILKPS